jgi:multiple antibiotic resistance protein
MDRLLTEVVTLWVVMDPIGTLPIFLAVTAGMNATKARRVAVRAILIALLVLTFFVLFGQILLTAMKINIASFQVAGNIVLFLFSLTMIFGESKLEEEKKLIKKSDAERAVFPLAIPSIATPGAMLAVMTVTDNRQISLYEQFETVAELVLILSIVLVLMLTASRIIAVIGNAGVSVISRVMGLILASVAVDGFVRAAHDIVAAHP